MPQFDRECLSKRETEILDLAVEGLTDYQIASRLDISPSTVNSYWVRIRGKLGHFSRTELVANTLREQFQKETAEMARQREADLRRMPAPHKEDDGLFRAVLEAIPESIAGVEEGNVVFVNRRLAEMFGYRAYELLGQPLQKLIAPKKYEAVVAGFADLADDASLLRFGVSDVMYGQRKTGEQFRILLTIGRSTFAGRTVATCLFRGFVDEVDMLRRRTAWTGVY